MKLLLGNEAVAVGAIEGGAAFFAGYPLAASSEIDAALLRLLPPRGGTAILAEDAPAALGAVLGAGAGGTLGVTAVTGSALGTLEELLRFGIRSGIPALVAVVGARLESDRRMECASQEETLRLRIGDPGGPSAPVWAPASSQECFTLACRAAAEARERATPVLVYVDDIIAHLREPVDVGPGSECDRPDPVGAESAGAGAVLYRARDAAVIVVAYGIVARAARTAVRLARDEGIRAGLFRPTRLWPFPYAEWSETASRARTVLVAELNEGLLWRELAARAGGSGDGRSIRSLSEPREGMLRPERILASLREAA